MTMRKVVLRYLLPPIIGAICAGGLYLVMTLLGINLFTNKSGTSGGLLSNETFSWAQLALYMAIGCAAGTFPLIGSKRRREDDS